MENVTHSLTDVIWINSIHLLNHLLAFMKMNQICETANQDNLFLLNIFTPCESSLCHHADCVCICTSCH